MAESIEQSIVKRAKKGDREAFGNLYDKYHSQIYRFLLVKVSAQEEAEDLTQQVFLKALEHLPRYEDLGFPFSSWLYRIARNAVIDHYRTQRQEFSLEESAAEEMEGELDLLLETEQALTREILLTAVRKLKPEYQDVILMRFVEDLSTQDIALAMEKSEGAVKVLQHRAIKALSKLLSPNESS